MTVSLPLGPLMLDLAGPRLTDEEREVLQHPLVGGVILFKRNFESLAVLQELTFEIHALRQPPLLIAIDHEGGRVQRFRHGFTVLPPMRALGVLWETDPARALETAEAAGYVLAAELRACGIDLSFTPVLDLDHGTSEIIGNRAFHHDPAAVTALAGALIAGLRRAGMANVGKHFPGHGFVAADSHVAIPVDTRPVQALYADLAPYRAHREMDSGRRHAGARHLREPRSRPGRLFVLLAALRAARRARFRRRDLQRRPVDGGRQRRRRLCRTRRCRPRRRLRHGAGVQQPGRGAAAAARVAAGAR
jgi:beta-glucosidase-like glycosyl hydrolase